MSPELTLKQAALKELTTERLALKIAIVTMSADEMAQRIDYRKTCIKAYC